MQGVVKFFCSEWTLLIPRGIEAALSQLSVLLIQLFALNQAGHSCSLVGSTHRNFYRNGVKISHLMVLSLLQAHGHGDFLILQQDPQRSILSHPQPILMQIFIPRIIFAGLTSAESPRISHTTTHRFYKLLLQPEKDTSSSAHYSCTCSSFSLLFWACHLKQEEMLIINCLQKQIMCLVLPVAQDWNPWKWEQGFLLALVGKTESSSAFHEWKQSIWKLHRGQQ